MALTHVGWVLWTQQFPTATTDCWVETTQPTPGFKPKDNFWQSAPHSACPLGATIGQFTTNMFQATGRRKHYHESDDSIGRYERVEAIIRV